MIDFQVLSGRKAGSRVAVSRFPFLIGRAAQNHLSLDDDGIWEQHLSVEFQKDGFHLSVPANAIATIDGQPVARTRLRNGDIITLGSVKLQFWISPAPQRGLSLRENFVWALLAAVTIGQFILICAFSR